MKLTKFLFKKFTCSLPFPLKYLPQNAIFHHLDLKAISAGLHFLNALDLKKAYIKNYFLLGSDILLLSTFS